MKAALFVLAVAAAVACNDSSTEPDTLEPQLSFQARMAGNTGLERSQAEAQGGVGEIRVTGRLATGDPCQTLTGEVTADGSVGEPVLTLRVLVRRRDGGACIAVVQNWIYEATLTGVRSGGYRLRVIHEYADARNRETPFDQRIEVR